MSSPFTPYLGTAPKTFVGREQEIADFQRFLKDSQHNKPSSALLIGQRGIGKTVLLKYFSGIAQQSNFCPVYLALDESSATPAALAKRIFGRVKAVLEDEFVTLRAKKFIQKIDHKLSVKLQDMEIEIGSSLRAEEINEDNFAISLGKLLSNRQVCVFCDETQSILRNGVARFIVNTLYAELPEYASKWVFVLAGIPVLEEKILKATPADRAFQKMELTGLNAKEVSTILQNTVKGTEVSFQKEACEDIVNDTKGMPYYVQFFGDKLFDLIETGIITKDFYLENKKYVLKELGETVFTTRIKDLEKRGLYADVLLQFAFLDRQEGVAANEVSNKISTYVGPYIKELETKGFIVKTSRGKYRITDDLFRNWLCIEKK